MCVVCAVLTVCVLVQLYPSGLPESVVQLLGATSRAATVEDISRWSITTVDTLSSLMNPDNGDWSPEQVTRLQVDLWR